MHPFDYYRATGESDAVARAANDPNHSVFIAGGTTLLDLMKVNVMQPTGVIDIGKLLAADIKPAADGLIVGALVRNSDLAHHPLVAQNYPILSQALLSGASPQLRNMATVGGNLMQRSRCPYFRDPTMACNKREPGSGCPAIPGYSRMHAILGVSDHCISAHPSDMCVALVALDAIVNTASDRGARQIPVRDFHLLPENHPERETRLAPGELITFVEIPSAASRFKKHSHYLKIRDRSSFTFALVSVAACLEMDANGKVVDARIALGGVGTKPWRVENGERLLIGSKLTAEKISAAAAEAVKDAQPQKYNRFKVELTKRSVARAIETAAGIS